MNRTFTAILATFVILVIFSLGVFLGVALEARREPMEVTVENAFPEECLSAFSSGEQVLEHFGTDVAPGEGGTLGAALVGNFRDSMEECREASDAR